MYFYLYGVHFTVYIWFNRYGPSLSGFENYKLNILFDLKNIFTIEI